MDQIIREYYRHGGSQPGWACDLTRHNFWRTGHRFIVDEVTFTVASLVHEETSIIITTIGGTKFRAVDFFANEEEVGFLSLIW